MQYYYQNSSNFSNRHMNYGVSRQQSVSNSYAQEENMPTTQRNFLNNYNQNADISQNQLHTTNNNIYQNLRNNANNLSISQAYQTDRFSRDVYAQPSRRGDRRNNDTSNDEVHYSDDENTNQRQSARQYRSRNRPNQQDSIHQQLHQQQQQLFLNSPSQQQKLSRNQLANIFNNNNLNYNVADLLNKNEQEKEGGVQKQEEDNLEKIQKSPFYVDANLIMKIFLVYVSTRAAYIMRKKVKKNQSILTDIILLISLKFENQIGWKWRDVFWAYWVFFSIMVGINIGFIIILFSKCYSKCSEDDVEVYELKGLFWLFILSNSLTVNITIYITSLISYYDDGDKQGVYFGFQYGLAFTIFLVVYSITSRESIYLFLFKITKDDDFSQENANQNEINENYHNHSNSHQQQQQQNSTQNNRRNQQNNQNQEQEQQEIEESQEESSNHSQRQSNFQNQNLPNQSNVKPQKKIKIVKIEEINAGLPLILQKLSATYFKIFKNVSSGTKQKGSKQNTKKKNAEQTKEEIQKNIIINCKSNSFISPREVQSNFNFKDANQDVRIQLSTKRSRVLQSKMELSTRSVAKSILLPLQDPQLKKMAKDTEEKYQNFLLSNKGVQIQKIIYEQNLNQEQKNINFSLEEIPKQHFNVDPNANDSQMPKDDKGEQSNFESNSEDVTQKTQNNINQNGNQSNYRSQMSSNMIQDETNKSNNITKTGKNIKQIACDQENLEITKQDNSIGNTCVVCFDKQPDTLYMPCGHGGLCYECAIDILKKTGECYLCRVEISEVYQLDIKKKKGKNFKVLAITQVLEDVSQFSEPNHQNPNANGIPFEQIASQLQERLSNAPQQNELMSASFHIGRQVNSPSNRNTVNRNFNFQQQANIQPQIVEPHQVDIIQLRNNNMNNFQISDKYLAEDVEKSFQDEYKQPNTFNVNQNYFSNEEIQQESNQNNVIIDQINGEYKLRQNEKDSSSPLDLKENLQNQLIKFDSAEETISQKEQSELHNYAQQFELSINNESPELKMNLLTSNILLNNRNLMKKKQAQFSVPQKGQEQEVEIIEYEDDNYEDETNNKQQQNTSNKDNCVVNNTLFEAALHKIQKNKEEEEEVEFPTENS